MAHVQNTVTDMSRAVAYLDENATAGNATDGAVRLVAKNLAYRFSLVNGWGGRKNVTTRDVRAALISHGASTFTVEQFARKVAHRIRNDFTEGRG